MNIVCAEKQDLADIYQLEHALFGDHAYPQFFFRQAFDCWGKGLLVAKQESKLAGYALMTTTDKPYEFWVLSLAVNLNYRGMGIGRKLMQHAIAQIPQESKLLLTVDPNNASACALYASMGFTMIKQEENYFGDDEPRLVMQLII
ncbi:GNAT family N-acetyltransferase [Vibrio sp. Isolate34]|uniref:GNAT family N-acetyltransferase n=1 Tax=Vibrio sp. Isolate34 TaxID=2908540 RepID=UPI001EFE0E82|nr:N-acetyltransferase [Vibrio sp. Isolate34]MCG9638429.1 GNAT family N-acetyltransferase [Vibrio sp. Isolate34]